MTTVLAEVPLRSHETLRIEQVLAPDPERSDALQPFLGHKPANYRAHIEAALAGACGSLETRFTLGWIGETLVGNVMTVERGGFGILGHVFTDPDHRRKGICQALFAALMPEFAARSGATLLLGTGYRSPAYFIYESFGFRDWEVGGRGLMRYDNPDRPEAIVQHFAPGPATVTPLDWGHWPSVALLASLPTPLPLRHLGFPVWDTALLEGGFITLLIQTQNDERTAAHVLETRTGAVRALATLMPDERWQNGPRRLDVLAHPETQTAELTYLLNGIAPRTERLQAVVAPDNTALIGALEVLGFALEAPLLRQFVDREGTWQDVRVYGRG
jgi:GNAT superfamily N-acetyltransferase